MKNFLAYAVAEIFLIFNLANIEEWQDRDAFFWRIKLRGSVELAAE